MLEGIAESDINNDVIPKNEIQRHILNMYHLFQYHHILPSEYKKQNSFDMDVISTLGSAFKSRGESLQRKKEMMENIRGGLR